LPDKSSKKRIICIFTLSLFVTLMILYIGDGIRKHIVHQRMVAYAMSSAREDGTPNRVIMLGKPGYLGYSSVQLSYLKDGWISLNGDNEEENNGWKLISTFTLEPGTYTLTGMKGQDDNTVALQLHIEDDTGFYRYIYQYDENVVFTIERPSNATLHVRVYPTIEGIDVKVRPAVYRDE